MSQLEQGGGKKGVNPSSSAFYSMQALKDCMVPTGVGRQPSLLSPWIQMLILLGKHPPRHIQSNV